ncbi:MAG: bifunctional diaminohydroxyphosphoribosylaminopyrimidine deaminase/5-amino-6-(5-phosphoribosylamino)uracil reductase RibD [Ferruginibacter sp.]|nr:bifunctional diaminohydroxyphosphoribosylaminopyrimidine deaminase/5-amino-6-(5-phosphoribosylamino)uracil reductase RibD [Ferruginibacter sp.]
MHRSLQLAKLGNGYVAPNPMVGAVLVHDDVIIGEGFHAKYGQAHAEVNCINSVLPLHKHLISSSTLYVSLEPCAHFGKTPPCVDLIINQQIKNVVIGCRDSFEQINGKGIEKLKANGVNVICDVLKEECLKLNKRFFTYHTKHRPYIILKWAQSGDGFIGKQNERIFISNTYSTAIVHKWRTQEAAIMIGTNTALQDNPLLTARKWQGKNPTRIVVDKNLKVVNTLQVFNNDADTIFLNSIKNEESNNIRLKKIESFDASSICEVLYQLQMQSVLIEGGATFLQSFINANMFDEIRVIQNEELCLQQGIAAPIFNTVNLQATKKYANDTISYFSAI